ncbi:asparagine synthase (glutamine-hydrolyzing), partial [bacterium]|nr:asparagine synthase (glutamine-hydrolyzing) [bacterium]
MCGIAGIVTFNNSVSITNRLLKKISYPNKYRGPDNYGVYIKALSDFSFGFSHNRLSIIDLSDNASQPMQSLSGRYVITFNGEIYNYKTLRKVLASEGTTFKTKSDTEVLLNAVEKWGIDNCLDRIDGMFAFAIFDLKKKELILARDRFGEKPLYYSKANNFIAFSSDIRSFNHLPIDKTINKHSLGYYFSEMCTPIENTIWNEINKVPPSNYISISKNKSISQEYWNLDYRKKINLSSEDIIRKSEALIENSVKKQLTSDVDVGCFLSGGVDSSLITYYASKFSPKKLKTFSVGFKDQKFNELPFAKIVSDKLNTDHHEIIIDIKSLSLINNLIEEYGEPFADVSAIPTFYITNFAGNHVKVALGGDGGDELFGGYNTYSQAWRMQQWINFKLSHRLINTSFKLFNSTKIKYLKGIISRDPSVIGSSLFRSIGFSNKEIFELTNDLKLSSAMENEHYNIVNNAYYFTENIFDTILHGSIKTRLVNDYLVKSDRASMFNSLELRSPFLDRNLQEFISKLHYQSLLKNKNKKFITKKILSKYFNQKFVNRTKQGFEMPIAELIRGSWKKDIEEVL